jgi:hypothetical protein
LKTQPILGWFFYMGVNLNKMGIKIVADRVRR